MKLPKLILEHTLIATLPLAIWVVAGYSHYHDLSFLPGGYVSATDVYGQGHLFFYPYKFLTQELVISVLFAFSAILLLMLLFKAATGSPIKSGMTKKTKFNILILIFSAGFIATQIITWSTGTLGSAGLMRYFVGIMPMMALFSGLALTWFSERLQSKSQYAFTLLASLLIIVSAVLTGLYATGKLDNGQPWLYDTSDYKLAGTWIADNLDAKTTVYYDRPETIYYSSRDLTNTFTTTPTVLNESGAVIVWTQSWGVSVGGLNEAELVERAQQLASFDEVVIYQVY